MIHDAKIEVTCDGESCREFLEVTLNYVHTDYTGENGHYDDSDDTIKAGMERAGWAAREDKHYCEDCKENEKCV